MKADLRISIKDCRRNKNLKVLLFRPPFPSRGFMVRMNGETWPKDGGPVCVTRLLTALRKSLVRAKCWSEAGSGSEAVAAARRA
jgi:hypothetical protein